MVEPRHPSGGSRELATLFLLGLLIFGVIGAVQAWTTRRAATDEARRSVQTLAAVLEDQASRTLTLAQTTVRAAADAVADAADLPTPARLRVLVEGAVIRGLALLDAEGRVLVGGQGERAGLPFPDRDLLDRARATRSAVVGVIAPGRSIVDPTGGPPGLWHVPVVVAVSGEGRVRYVVGAFNPQVFGDLYAVIGGTDRYRMLVQDTGGAVVGASESVRVRVGDRLPLPPIGPWDEGRGPFETTLGHTTLLAAYATVRQWPFVVTVGVDRAELTATSLDHLTPLALLLAVSMMIVLAAWTRLAREVAARRRSEADAILARQRLEDAIESVPDGFVLFDRDDRLVTCNARYRTILDRVGSGIDAGVTYRAIVRAAIERGQYALGDAGPAAFEEALVAEHRTFGPPVERALSDGRWIRVTKRPTSEGGTVGISADVTDLKRVATDLAAARDLAELASRAKSDFLAAMSHEIRTPLNGVIATADLLASALHAEDVRTSVDLIRRSGRTLLAILDEILDYSQIEGGHVRIEERACDVVAIVGDVASLFTATCAQKGIAIDVRPAAPVSVRTDPDRFRQILNNLVANAVKFTEAGGITIATEVATAASGRVLLVVHIEDTGIGIAENDIPRLFERFTQGEGGNARRYGGTGLGLAISRGLARLLGGDISVRSRPGVGSRFTLRLDLAGAAGDDAPADAPAPDATPPGCRPLDGVRVLVADDNEVNRLVVGHILQTLGASPVIVDDGFAAVERVQAEPFDVVLMDVQMPGLSGPDATRRIRRLDADVRHIPVIALTANVLANDREAYAAAGMTAHLAKPVDLAQLTDAILAATGRRAPARPAA